MKAGRSLARAAAILGVTVAALSSSAAWAGSATSGSLRFCDRQQALTATQQDRLLRFTAIVRDQLAATEGDAVLISRSGLDLSRFGIRYSHAAIAWRSETGAWSARQLYYACDESRPRLYDQGLAGFAMGIDDPNLGYVSIVRLPAESARQLEQAALDKQRALHLLAASYSANAYAYSLRHQNCNQWVIEMLAAAWGGLPDGDDLRARAQGWLREAGYAPEPVNVNSHALMFASSFVPLLHLDDHPEDDLFAMKLEISLPAAVEQFVRDRVPGSERIELCHDGRQTVIHSGWSPVATGCLPEPEDRVVPLD